VLIFIIVATLGAEVYCWNVEWVFYCWHHQLLVS